jgi:hypothetical protein
LTTEHLLTLLAAILACIAAVIAATVSVYNARFRRFARERWWERQVEAYNRIIDALSALVYYYEEHYEAEIEHRSLTDSHKKEISEHWRKGYAEVKRATAVGAFLISPTAEAALQKMWKEKGKGVAHNDWFGLIESDYVAARKCLRAVVKAAKKDLRVAWQA